MLPNLLLYALSFVGIWIGSGLAIGSVGKLSKILRASSFLISFVVLGAFTSVSEFSVGVNAVIERDPEIYVGNLIGASIVIFMLVIPLLAIVSNGIKINSELKGFNLVASLAVVAWPVVMALDGKIDRFDSILVVIAYGVLVVITQAKKGLLEKINTIGTTSTIRVSSELFRVILGVAIIFVASRFVVQQTEYFSQILGLSPFVLSLLLIAIGTNIPELSLVARSIFMKTNQVAFGDYVGSAAFNTLLIGALTLFYGETVVLTNSYLISLFFLVVGLVIFYFFARTKNFVSRTEGFLMLFFYLLFLTVEIFIHQ